MVTGVVIKCLSDLDSASEKITFISSIDVAFTDQTGLERTHYDGKPVGTGLAACRCFDKAFYIALSVRVKTSQIIISLKVTSNEGHPNDPYLPLHFIPFWKQQTKSNASEQLQLIYDRLVIGVVMSD